jgi:hypothetical protein
MKRCPACHKTYDETQNFCLDDGTVLVSAAADAYGSAAPTESFPVNRGSAPTEVLHGIPTAGGYQGPTTPPPPYMSPPQARKRSPLPWIIAGALVLAAAVVGVALAMRGSNSATTVATNGGGQTPSPTTSPAASPVRTSSTPAASGSTYESPDGRFQITLPLGFSSFTSQTTTQSTPAGPIDLTIMQSENPQGAAVMGYSDFPDASFVGRTPKKMLEDGRDGALKNINAALEKQEEITVQGRTGLKIYGSTTNAGRDIYVRFQFILDKPRAYQIGYLAYNRADLDKPEVQAYFDSFKMK